MSNSVLIYDSDKLDISFEKLIQAINIIKNNANNEINKLKSQLEIKPIQKFSPLFLENISIRLENYNWAPKYVKIFFSQECNRWLKENKKDIITEIQLTEQGIQNAFKIIDIIAEHDKSIHEENIIKKRSNKETYIALSNLLDRIGIQSKYYGYPSKRSRNKEWITYNWVHEIFSQIPCNYDENLLEKLVKKHKDEIQQIYNDEIKRIEEEQKKKEAEQHEKERNKKLALLFAKYDLDLNCDWEDLLEIVISKNKYLNLAYYLERNRGDWSNGCNYAIIGLHNFKIENELDQKIYDDIRGCIDNWDGDGRVFRDCQYNYSVLYNMAAEQEPDLYKDFEVIVENIDEF